jgi:hypothetical protein
MYGATMNQQNDERTKKSRLPEWKQYKSSVFYGLAGSVLCIVAFLFANLPLNPNQDTIKTSNAFLRLLIIMFGIPFTLSVVRISMLSEIYRKTHQKDALDTSGLITAAMMCAGGALVGGIFFKTLLRYGFWGLVGFGFLLGFFAVYRSRQVFDTVIKLKK